MFVIHIKEPSKSQMKQHCQGKGFRIVEGSFPVTITSPDAIKKIKSSFRKGKGYTLKPHEIEGKGLKELYTSAKKAIGTEIRQTARSAKKVIGDELRQTGREIKKTAIKEGNVFIKEVAKPYLSEMVQTGIMSLAAAGSALQPELAPFILTGGLAASAMAGNYIENFGNRPRTIEQAQIIQEQQEPLKYDDVAEDDPMYVDPHQLYRTPMRDMSQSQRGLIGFGLGSTTKKGSGLFSGGKLLLRGEEGLMPYALLSPDPKFMLNRNLLSAAEQNALYTKD
jgi:hypothetical protein